MALSTNTLYPVLKGPGVGRLMLAVFGDSEGDGGEAHSLLTFTIIDADDVRHAVKMVFTGLDKSYVRMVFGLTGILREINGKVQPISLASLPIEVQVSGFWPVDNHRDANLKINDHVGLDLEKIFTEYSNF